MRLLRRRHQEGPAMLPSSSRTASDHAVPDQIARCASLVLPVRHQGRPPPGSPWCRSAYCRSTAGSSPSAASLSMVLGTATEPPLLPPIDAAASPVCRVHLSTAPRRLSPAQLAPSFSDSSRPTFFANSRGSSERLQ